MKGSFCFLALLFVKIYSLPLSPILSPDSSTIYIGRSVHFYCKKISSMQIAWDTPLWPTVFRDDNVSVSRFEVTGVSDALFNNSVIYCVTRYLSQPTKVYYSNPGVLLIQGYLGKVDVNLTRLDVCTVQVYWTAPFTLPNAPILGYNVNITNLGTKEKLNLKVNKTRLNIPLGYNYIVSVAGVNDVGEGNISMININSTDFISASEIANSKTNVWKMAIIVNNTMCKASYATCDQYSDNANCHDDDTSDISQMLQSKNWATLSATWSLSFNRRVKRSSNTTFCTAIIYLKGSVTTGSNITLKCNHNFNYTELFHNFWCSPNLPNVAICLLHAYDEESDNALNETYGQTIKRSTVIKSSVLVISPSSNLNDEPQSGVHDHELLLQSIGIFIAVGGCTCAFVIFVAVLLVVICLKKRKPKKHPSEKKVNSQIIHLKS